MEHNTRIDLERARELCGVLNHYAEQALEEQDFAVSAVKETAKDLATVVARL